jgi:hypothetical protein
MLTLAMGHTAGMPANRPKAKKPRVIAVFYLMQNL